MCSEWQNEWIADLTSHRDFRVPFEANRTVGFVRVVKHDRYAGPCDACLPSLIYEIGLMLRSHLYNVRMTITR